MKAINHYNKSQLLTRIQTQWNFRTSPLIHDIPLPLTEAITNVKTITIPLEILTTEDTYQINHILRSQSKQMYFKDAESQLFIGHANDIDIFEEVNAVFFDIHFKWIVCSSIVLLGEGITITFGGEKLIALLKQNFKDKIEWKALF